MKNKLYLWNNYHNGDIISMIPLIWEIYNQINDVEVVVGCFSNHAYLFEETPVSYLLIHPGDDVDGKLPDDLSYMCPEGFTNIYTWLGQYGDTQAHNWENQVKVFNRKCKENSLPISITSNIVPGIKLPYSKIDVPLHSKMVWVENGRCRSGHSAFDYDMGRLGSLFPDLYFYTTSNPNCKMPNVINCSHLNLIELSNLSNMCDIILGKGSGPFFVTLTDTNRYKPKAVVGYNLNTHLPFWDYPYTTLKYLDSQESLINFIQEVINN